MPCRHFHLPLLVEVILLWGEELRDEERGRRLQLHVVDPPQGVAQEVAPHQPRKVGQGEEQFGLDVKADIKLSLIVWSKLVQK